jgi:hypothetical protein
MIFIFIMIKLKDLVPLVENSSDAVEFEVGPSQHEVKTLAGTDVFITNLRRDSVNIELKMTNGVVFVTVK